uniref:Uncharacterized protein n=1 Tax=Populus trichocarpa TaxID=3694 RepID=A0A2K2AHD6_POPTR
MIVSQVQGKACLANTSNPKYLDLEVSHVQINEVHDNMGLVNMSDLKHLDLTVSQVQGNACLTNMSNPRFLGLGSLRSPRSRKYIKPKVFGLGSQSSPRQRGSSNHTRPKAFGLAVSKIQGNDHLPLGMFKGMTILSWSKALGRDSESSSRQCGFSKHVDLKNLNLTVSQLQGNDHHLLARRNE